MVRAIWYNIDTKKRKNKQREEQQNENLENFNIGFGGTYSIIGWIKINRYGAR